MRALSEASSYARSRVRWARMRLDSLGRGPADPLGELAASVYAVNALESACVLYVEAARAAGASWGQIGAAMGVSRQAARQRYMGAVARAQAHRDDWRVRDLAQTRTLAVVEQRGVWEGRRVVTAQPAKQPAKQPG